MLRCAPQALTGVAGTRQARSDHDREGDLAFLDAAVAAALQAVRYEVAAFAAHASRAVAAQDAVLQHWAFLPS